MMLLSVDKGNEKKKEVADSVHMESYLKGILKAEEGVIFTGSNIPCCKLTSKNTIKYHRSHQLFEKTSSEKYNLRFKLFWKSHGVGVGIWGGCNPQKFSHHSSGEQASIWCLSNDLWTLANDNTWKQTQDRLYLSLGGEASVTTHLHYPVLLNLSACLLSVAKALTIHYHKHNIQFLYASSGKQQTGMLIVLIHMRSCIGVFLVNLLW